MAHTNYSRLIGWVFRVLFLLLPLSELQLAAEEAEVETSAVVTRRWKRTILDRRFRSEGVAIADVDRDGDQDVLVGDLWYEAPAWQPHEIRPPGEYGDGAHGYSDAFLCFAEDLNHDSWPDLIVIDMPGEPCSWYENPQGRQVYWRSHLISDSACNESPAYVDLFGDGRRSLVMAWRTDPEDEASGELAWFEPGTDPDGPWRKHAISQRGSAAAPIPGTHRFAHGLGTGDIDGDGRNDVVCTDGWWQQPDKLSDEPWPFHAVKLGEPCAQMFVDDVTGEGIADVLSSSAHNYGIWVHEGVPSEPGARQFHTRPLFPHLVSQTHGLAYADINGDGLCDLVTGKRWWAHGPDGDPGSSEPAHLYWFEASIGPDGSTNFTPRLIDEDAGVGLHLVVADVNGDGKCDVVVSNKKGVSFLEQVTVEPAEKSPADE